MHIYSNIWYRFLHLPLVIIFVFIACTDTNSNNIDIKYFDLEDFIDFQKSSKNYENITQYIEINGKKDTLQLANEDLDKIYGIISKANINIPKLYGKYVHTIAQMKILNHEKYVAKDSSLKVRKLEVIHSDDNVKELLIQENFGSFISRSIRTIRFFADSLVMLENKTKNQWMEPKTLKIHWKLKSN